MELTKHDLRDQPMWFNLQRFQNNSPPVAASRCSDSETSEFSDHGRVPGGSFMTRVQSVLLEQLSLRSDPVCLCPPPAPQAPVQTDQSASPKQVVPQYTTVSPPSALAGSRFNTCTFSFAAQNVAHGSRFRYVVASSSNRRQTQLHVVVRITKF